MFEVEAPRTKDEIGTALAVLSHELERYSEGEDARASLRVRVREIKDVLGEAMGERLGAGDLIINVRDRGYRLMPRE